MTNEWENETRIICQFFNLKRCSEQNSVNEQDHQLSGGNSGFAQENKVKIKSLLSNTLRQLIKEFGRISEFGWIIKNTLGTSFFGSKLFSEIIQETQFDIKISGKKRAFSTPKVKCREDLGQHLWGKVKKEKSREFLIMQRSESEMGSQPLEIGKSEEETNRTSISDKKLDIANEDFAEIKEESQQSEEQSPRDNNSQSKDEENQKDENTELVKNVQGFIYVIKIIF